MGESSQENVRCFLTNSTPDEAIRARPRRRRARRSYEIVASSVRAASRPAVLLTSERRALDSIGWTDATADDVWLALDLNDNGLIENGGELFGNATEQSEIPLPNGFNALADYDKAKYGGNGDGWISAADPIYVYLVLWRDQNHNGVSESTELFSLQSLNVVAISLGYQSWRHADPNGNEFRYVSEVIVNIGGTPVSRAAVDVYLVANGGTPALAP